MGSPINTMASSTVRVIVNFLSRDKEAFIRSASQLMISTRQEPGCLVANLYKEMGSTAEPGTTRYVVISNWSSETALESHMKTEHVKIFGDKIKEHSSLETIRRYQRLFEQE